MRVLFFGTYDADRHPRVRVLQEGLVDHGDEIIECNAPLHADSALRLRVLRRPWLGAIVGAQIGARWWRLWRKSRRLPAVDAVVVGYFAHLDVRLARRLCRTVPLALDYLISVKETAIDRKVTSGPLLRFLDWLDMSSMSVADLVLVDTEENLEALPAEARSRAVVVPVGAPNRWFRAPRSGVDGPLRMIFFGLYTPLQGAPFIGGALNLLKREGRDLHVTMVGRGQEYEATRRAVGGAAQVRWVDWVEPGLLPSLVSGHHVCLGIFGTGPKASRVVPNKVFQGAAAGCAIVTADTAPQRRTLGAAAVYVPQGDPEALAAAVRSLDDDRSVLQALRRAAYQRAEQAFRPAHVVRPLRDRLAQGTAG